MPTVGQSQIRVTEARVDLLKRRIDFCRDAMLKAALERDLKETEERLTHRRRVVAGEQMRWG
jgi:hypothetical protein